jgi:hypothetical protein
MIKQLHSKTTPNSANRRSKLNSEVTVKQIIQELSRDLLKPREEAIQAILAKAAMMQ